MFGIGLPELLLIMGLGLIILGPDKLPELAKQLAKGMIELKRTANALKNSIQEEIEDEDGNSPLLDDLNEVAGQPWRGLDGNGGEPTGKLPDGFDEFGVINTVTLDKGVGVNDPADAPSFVAADEVGAEEPAGSEPAEQVAEAEPASEAVTESASVETSAKQEDSAA